MTDRDTSEPASAVDHLATPEASAEESAPTPPPSAAQLGATAHGVAGLSAPPASDASGAAVAREPGHEPLEDDPSGQKLPSPAVSVRVVPVLRPFSVRSLEPDSTLTPPSLDERPTAHEPADEAPPAAEPPVDAQPVVEAPTWWILEPDEILATPTPVGDSAWQEPLDEMPSASAALIQEPTAPAEPSSARTLEPDPVIFLAEDVGPDEYPLVEEPPVLAEPVVELTSDWTGEPDPASSPPTTETAPDDVPAWQEPAAPVPPAPDAPARADTFSRWTLEPAAALMPPPDEPPPWRDAPLQAPLVHEPPNAAETVAQPLIPPPFRPGPPPFPPPWQEPVEPAVPTFRRWQSIQPASSPPRSPSRGVPLPPPAPRGIPRGILVTGALALVMVVVVASLGVSLFGHPHPSVVSTSTRVVRTTTPALSITPTPVPTMPNVNVPHGTISFSVAGDVAATQQCTDSPTLANLSLALNNGGSNVSVDWWISFTDVLGDGQTVWASGLPPYGTVPAGQSAQIQVVVDPDVCARLNGTNKPATYHATLFYAGASSVTLTDTVIPPPSGTVYPTATPPKH